MTTRAKPDRSFEAACRHLFRHLHEPAELRRNPLVSKCFREKLDGFARARFDATVACALRDAIVRHAELCFAVDRIENPQRAEARRAIIYADVERVPRSRREKELGLSAREYSRLQRGIRARIAGALFEELAAKGVNAHKDVASPLLEVAELVSRGRPLEALSRLPAIIDYAGAAVTSLALCLRATIIQRHVGDLAAAHRALAESRQCLQSVEATDPLAPAAAAEIDLTTFEMNVIRGRYDRATHDAVRLLHRLQKSSVSLAVLTWRAHAIAAYGNLALGKRAEAVRYVNTMLSDLAVIKSASITEQIEIAFELSFILGELGRISDALALLAQALVIARQAHFDLDTVRLDLTHTAYALEYDVSIASRRFPEICRASEELGSPGLIARAYVYLTRAQMREARPNPNKVLANARRVLTLAPPPSPEWIAGKAAEAFARVMLSDLVGAERSARDADDAAAATANQACRGYTLREVARVAAAQGQKRRAKRAIMAAIDASYACGKRQQTVQSLKLAAKILHEPAYAAEATAMQEAMSLNSPFFALATPGRTFPSD